MTDRDDILLLLGEIKGTLAGFLTGQSKQDDRMDGIDTRMSKLEDSVTVIIWKVAGIVGALGALGVGIDHFLKG